MIEVSIDRDRDRAFCEWVAAKRLARMDAKRPGRDTIETTRKGHGRRESILDGVLGEAGFAVASGLTWDVTDHGYSVKSHDVGLCQVKTNSRPMRDGRAVGDLMIPKLGYEGRGSPFVLVYRLAEWRVGLVGYRFAWELDADRSSRSPVWWTDEGSERYERRRLRAACWLVPPQDLISIEELAQWLEAKGFRWRAAANLEAVAKWRA